MKKRKRRSVASYRSASLKGARVRKQMQLARVEADTRSTMRAVFDDMLPPERTINRIPKVEWK